MVRSKEDERREKRREERGGGKGEVYTKSTHACFCSTDEYEKPYLIINIRLTLEKEEKKTREIRREGHKKVDKRGRKT